MGVDRQYASGGQLGKDVNRKALCEHERLGAAVRTASQDADRRCSPLNFAIAPPVSMSRGDLHQQRIHQFSVQ
jgi:hypothetical protein